MNTNLKTKLSELPDSPGIYKYFDKEKNIIYIGKASSLKKRVKSYFIGGIRLGPKTSKMVSEIFDIEITKTENEVDALILEAELIKTFMPKYNILLKDDKFFNYIEIKNEKLKVLDSKGNSKLENIPRITTTRKKENPDSEYFGPFPSGSSVQGILRQFRKTFKYRNCSKIKYNRYQKIGRSCLFGDIGLCSAPCVGRVTAKEYRLSINQFKKLLQGNSKNVLRDIEKEMQTASKNQDYDLASKIRDKFQNLVYITTDYKDPSQYINNPNLTDDLYLGSLMALKDAIPSLEHIPVRIEGYDISNIQGTNPTASMVVATNGILNKNEYKKFKIKTKNTPDDFAMMSEVIRRRFKNNWEMPDLILIDGGKGQVSSAMKELAKLNIKIPIVGLAKKQELLVLPINGTYDILNLSKDNLGLRLLMNLRDEAHRFALNYHRKLRRKEIS